MFNLKYSSFQYGNEKVKLCNLNVLLELRLNILSLKLIRSKDIPENKIRKYIYLSTNLTKNKIKKYNTEQIIEIYSIIKKAHHDELQAFFETNLFKDVIQDSKTNDLIYTRGGKIQDEKESENQFEKLLAYHHEIIYKLIVKYNISSILLKRITSKELIYSHYVLEKEKLYDRLFQVSILKSFLHDFSILNAGSRKSKPNALDNVIKNLYKTLGIECDTTTQKKIDVLMRSDKIEEEMKKQGITPVTSLKELKELNRDLYKEKENDKEQE